MALHPQQQVCPSYDGLPGVCQRPTVPQSVSRIQKQCLLHIATCIVADHLFSRAAAPRVGHSTVGVRLNSRDCLIIFGGDSSGHGSSELLDDTRLVDFTDIEAPCWRDLYPEDGPRPSARTEHTAVATVRIRACVRRIRDSLSCLCAGTCYGRFRGHAGDRPRLL